MKRVRKIKKIKCQHDWVAKKREGIDFDSWYDGCAKCDAIKTPVDERVDFNTFIRIVDKMEHKGLKDLHNKVVKGDFLWERWGLLRCLSDFILNFSKGDILEIGCGESSIHFSRLAEMYDRKCYHVDFSNSGIENMKNTKGYFGKNSKVFNMKSDSFFSVIEGINLAIAFIDGDHVYEQAKKDFDNVFPYVVDTGMIFLHDTYPRTKDWTVPQRCGTVYLLRKELEERDDIDVFTFTRTAFDVGLTMIRKKIKTDL